MLSSVPLAQMSYSTEASIPEVSRQGRDNQRYAATGERLVAGCVFASHSSIFVSMRHPRARNSSLLVMCKIVSQCRCIPFRFVDDARSPSSVQVLLITSSGGNGWVFPKGGWELDETAESAALRETVEEGGVRGDLDPAVLGAYPYSNRKTSPTRKGCIAHMYAMSVREELSVWPESHSRERCWVCTITTCYSWILHAYTWSPELTIHLAWHKTN